MACLTLGGRKSLSIVREPMGIWSRGDYSTVSDRSFRVVEDALHCDFLDAPSSIYLQSIDPTLLKHQDSRLTLLLSVSWHITLSRIDDNTMPLTRWPRQSQQFQPCSIGRANRRRSSMRRHAAKSSVSHYLNPNDQIVIHGSFVESILVAGIGGLVPWKCEPRHSEQLRPCALSAELIWPTC